MWWVGNEAIVVEIMKQGHHGVVDAEKQVGTHASFMTTEQKASQTSWRMHYQANNYSNINRMCAKGHEWIAFTQLRSAWSQPSIPCAVRAVRTGHRGWRRVREGSSDRDGFVEYNMILCADCIRIASMISLSQLYSPLLHYFADRPSITLLYLILDQGEESYLILHIFYVTPLNQCSRLPSIPLTIIFYAPTPNFHLLHHTSLSLFPPFLP